MNVIEDTATLKNFCQGWRTQPFITVDLEFLRERTYYARLCLIQVGSLGECAVIDPLAPELDLAEFFDLMQNPAVTKVFHSGRQDLEIIFNLTGKIPAPLFDTQVAAMVCGFGESISYENLVKQILGIELDKSSRLSDWSRRPLKPDQLKYALSDVTHLIHVYQHLTAELKNNRREDWIADEMAVLDNPETYVTRPEEAWHRIKHRSHNARFLTILRELAAWREARSQNRNTPRQTFIRDDALLTIASACPQTKEELAQIRNLRPDVAGGRLGTEIIEVMRHVAEIPEQDYVTPPHDKIPHYNTALYELLRMLLRIKSTQENVVSRLIADDDDLKLLSCGKDKGCRVLSGWRYDIFGRHALELRSGKLCVAYNPRSKEIDFIPVPAGK